jgi:hypothetical protein
MIFTLPIPTALPELAGRVRAATTAGTNALLTNGRTEIERVMMLLATHCSLSEHVRVCACVCNMLSLDHKNFQHKTLQNALTFHFWATCFSSNIIICRLHMTYVFTLYNICTSYSAVNNLRFISNVK